MHRKYRPRHYADRIAKARALMPDCAVGADVMTGFPGETDAEFEDSRAFIESLPFTYLHVFTYSERPGTPAADTSTGAHADPQTPDPGSARTSRKKESRIPPLDDRTKNLSSDARWRQSAERKFLEGQALNKSAPPTTLKKFQIAGLTTDGLHESGMLPIL